MTTTDRTSRNPVAVRRLARGLRGVGLSVAWVAGVGAAGAVRSIRTAYPRAPQGAPAGGVDRLPRVGLPQARVGLHSGPVVFQSGDYFGRTVNVAARIGDYARPGEVLISDQVVADADRVEGVRFEPVGPVSLKGLSAPITLYNAVPAD